MMASILLFLLLYFTNLQDSGADFAVIKPAALYYNYVSLSWLSNNVVLAAGYSDTGGVILRSSDQGNSWSSVRSQSSGFLAIASESISGTWYSIAVDEMGVTYRSVNNGMSWQSYDTNSSAILMGASIGANGYSFISGRSYIAYGSSVSAAPLTWTDVTPSGNDFNDIR